MNAWRRDAYLSPEGGVIVCHARGARFAPAKGLCTAGPREGKSLILFDSRIDTAGRIVVARGWTLLAMWRRQISNFNGRPDMAVVDQVIGH